MRILKKELWPEKVNIIREDSDIQHYHIETWLEENLGPERKRWNRVSHYYNVDYYFKNKKDSMWFVLRWA